MMLQKTFGIYSGELINQHLFIELGYHHLACWCKKDNENKFSAFELFQCEDYDASVFDSLISEAKLHSRLITLDVLNTNFFWNTIENLTVPVTFAEDSFLQHNFNLINGSTEGKIYQSHVGDVSFVTRVDVYLNNAAQKIFPSASFNGAFKLHQPVEETAVYIFFYPNCFFVTVYQNKNLLFAKSKLYINPADVLYFILNLVYQYKLEKNIPVIAGGFIDEQSNLFEMLYQYLEGFKLGTADKSLFGSEEFKQFPSHYFLPYINYAL